MQGKMKRQAWAGTVFRDVLINTSCLVLFASSGLILIADTEAALIHTEAEATMTYGYSFAPTYLPIGTVVSSSVDFDMGSGIPSSFPNIHSATGLFTWHDEGLRVFQVSQAEVVRVDAEGMITINFMGTGPLIDGLTATSFGIYYDIGINPFQTNVDLTDLLPDSTINRLSLYVSNDLNWVSAGYLTTAVTGFTIPEPTTLVLLSFGGLALVRRKHVP
jgi:hypothetical protein